MSKGGTKTVSTQSTVPGFIQPFYERGLQEALANFESTKPSFFPGATTVGLAPETQQALSGIRDSALAGSPLTQQAQNYTQQVLAGDFLGQNPFFNQVFNPAAEAVTNQVQSAMSRAGRLGSGANTDILSQNLADLAGNLAFQQYGAERGRQDAAARFAPALDAQRFADFQRLEGVGRAREAQQAAELQDQIRRFEFEQQLPSQKLADYLTAVRGGTFGSVQQQPVLQSRGQSFLGGALGGAQLGNLIPGVGSLAGAIGGGLLGGLV